MRLLFLVCLSATANTHLTQPLNKTTLKFKDASDEAGKEDQQHFGWSPVEQDRNANKRKSQIYCKRYLELCSVSGRPHVPNIWGKIYSYQGGGAVGGVTAVGRSHPHMALIGYGQNKEWFCGGSLLSEKFVLSAAHCAVHSNLGPAQWARLGELDYSTDKDDASPQDRKIVKRIIHPKFKEPPLYHDIALFLLEKPVKFTPWVKPVCLHTTRPIPFKKVHATGWGRTGYVEGLSSHLVEVTISLVPSNECKPLVGNGSRIPHGLDSDTMVCAGEKHGMIDTCSGDSGGPLVMKLSGRCLWIQVGITSFGKQCALPDSPGIYTRVSHYLPWIEGIVWP